MNLGHELNGAMNILDCRVRGIHVPLLVLCDYRGWRLLAGIKTRESYFVIILKLLCYLLVVILYVMEAQMEAKRYAHQIQNSMQKLNC